jgi:putative transposase
MIIPGRERAGSKPAPTIKHHLSEIVRAFKTYSSRRINELRNTPGTSVWQRNYYEHVIRGEIDYHKAEEYIYSNPLDN